MNIINIEHINLLYGDKDIFDDACAAIDQGDKIGIVGINGTGKTTFLRLIAGLEEPDQGRIVRANNLKITFLPQHPRFPEHSRVLDYVTQNKREDDWKSDTDAKKILNRLGISDFEEEIDHLSGGQKKRIALARALVNPADVLILDEPTNHLDHEMTEWLEDFLKSYRGTIIMVTHDRYFLDRVTDRIFEISHGSIYTYDANYSTFLERKAQREEIELASERKRQSILRMELEWARRGCQARSTKQRARLKRLEDLKNGKAPQSDAKVELDSIKSRMGKKTIELNHVSKAYGDKICLNDFSYIVLKDQRLGIVGKNGCGKSTLLKMIAGRLSPDKGSIEIGDTIRLGYFSQEIEDMDSGEKVIDYIKDVAEYIPTKEGLISATKLLERFLFDSSMQYSPIEKLSGGEKKRLYLMKILAAAPNVLLLDEITNDLDIPTLTILEDYLDTFPGIVVVVSHDRYFLDNVVSRILAFDDSGNISQYEGNYTDYHEALRASGGGNRESDHKESQKQSSGFDKNKPDASKDSCGTEKNTYKRSHAPKLKFTYKEQREFETIDEDIEALENMIARVDEDIMKNATNSGRLNELTRQKEELSSALEEKTERWVYLNELAELIEAQKG